MAGYSRLMGLDASVRRGRCVSIEFAAAQILLLAKPLDLVRLSN